MILGQLWFLHMYSNNFALNKMNLVKWKLRYWKHHLQIYVAWKNIFSNQISWNEKNLYGAYRITLLEIFLYYLIRSPSNNFDASIPLWQSQIVSLPFPWSGNIYEMYKIKFPSFKSRCSASVGCHIESVFAIFATSHISKNCFSSPHRLFWSNSLVFPIK